MFFRNVAANAVFSPEKMGKVTLVQGSQMMAGLNCFEPGQEHSLHVHADQEKLYVVVEGTALVRIGADTQTLRPGEAAFASNGIAHSVRNPGPGRLVMMAILSPPPR